MSNNKQSSVVDFIYNELFVVKRWMDLTPGDIEYIFKQAKVMHKEEIEQFFKMGMSLVEGRLWKPIDKFEEAYNETYGGNNEN